MIKIIALLYTIIAAIIFANWEIQIEGKNGWASNLPCWRSKNKWINTLMGNRPLTGYHLYLIIFLVLIIHFPLFFTQWTLEKEFFLISFLFCFLLLEDFFWFVFNPHYKLKKFKKGNIEWHKNWWGPMPDFYWWFAGIAAAALYLALHL